MERFKWLLNESDITENVCKSCAICCEIDIKMNWKDRRQFDWLHVMVEKHDHIQKTPKGVRIRCSHLEGSDVLGFKCGIYDKRPQLCSDFNCVSWAKVNNDLEVYNRVLDKLGITDDNMEKV